MNINQEEKDIYDLYYMIIAYDWWIIDIELGLNQNCYPKKRITIDNGIDDWLGIHLSRSCLCGKGIYIKGQSCSHVP
jgi:hypothetical protein